MLMVYRFSIRLFSLFVIAVLLLAPVQQANAKKGAPPTPPPLFYSWRAYVDFPDDKLRVIWIVAALGYNQDRQLIEHKDVITHDISEKCSLVGKQPDEIVIENNRAFFNGGYIHCPLPDFKQELGTYLNGKPSSCGCDPNGLTPPWFAARFGAQPKNFPGQTLPLLFTVQPPPGEQPIYKGDGWRFQLQIQDNGVSNTHLWLDQWVGNPGSSQAFALDDTIGAVAFSGYGSNVYAQLADFNGRDHFLDDPNFRTAANNSQLPNFLAWVQDSYPMDRPIPLEGIKKGFSTDLYIGYNGQEYFRGWISDALGDPGCSGAK